MIDNVMATARDRILIVEKDPMTADIIGRQTLQSAGYQTYVVNDAGSAVAKIMQISPDLVLANLNLPGLSGKDLLVALSSQQITTPVIVMTAKGMENDVIQAFRLGAADYLIWPAREPEIINAVERVLGQVRERREREQLSGQLQQANQELQARVRELTAITGIGKAVTSITDQSLLFEKILEGGLKITRADFGWFLLREDNQKGFILAAQKGLPPAMANRLNQPWDDGISSLVAMSGETLSIHGDPLKRFKISSLGQSALVVPTRAQKQIIGLLVMMRKEARPFNQGEQHLLKAVADYASISLVNARLFRAVEERARALQVVAENAQAGEKVDHEILQIIKAEIRPAVSQGLGSLDKLAHDPTARWSAPQRQLLTTVQDQLNHIANVAETITPLSPGQLTPSVNSANLHGLVRQAASRFQPIAQASNITLTTDLPPEIILAAAHPTQVSQVLDALLSNALGYSNPGGRVWIHLEQTTEKSALVCVSDSGPGMPVEEAPHVFDANFHSSNNHQRRFGGLGIRLSLAREIIHRFNGKIWVETRSNQGCRFYFTLPVIGRQEG